MVEQRLNERRVVQIHGMAGTSMVRRGREEKQLEIQKGTPHRGGLGSRAARLEIEKKLCETNFRANLRRLLKAT